MYTQENQVKERYAAAAKECEPELCCPVDYNTQYLEALPDEVIQKDYGCGDPSKYVQEGETVLDLGSGTGKICFIAAQVVGKSGKVIGVDLTDEMLEVARRNAPIVAQKTGTPIVEFRKGRIQDLQLDLDKLDAILRENPIHHIDDYLTIAEKAQKLRTEDPLIPDQSIDVVVSNCVLNLVDTKDKKQLFGEIFRVLKPGGRAVISDIVSDQPIPGSMANDPELWSGCISGAYTESGFLKSFEEAGFYGIELVKYETKPWRTVNGIEFRSVTVRAFRGKGGECFDHNEAVIYKGPFSQVMDDDGHILLRGERMAVCRRTFDIYSKAPYANQFELVSPRKEVTVTDAKPFDCKEAPLRSPQQTKGEDYVDTTNDSCCC